MAIQLQGPWDKGYALDLHTTGSTYLGVDEYGHKQFDTQYTPIGKLVKDLKYRNDKSTIPDIVEKIRSSVNGIENFDFITAIPPSNTERLFQPVFLICEALSKQVSVTYLENALVKKVTTEELKNVTDFEQRKELLSGKFMLKPGIDLIGKKVLLLDDLYRSGATLAAATEFLYNDCKVQTVSVLTLTKTRSNR